MQFAFVLYAAVYLMGSFQNDRKPAVSIQTRIPSAIPVGSCTEDEYGYLDTSKGNNQWVPYSPSELGEYVADRVKRGFVVKVYPQPNGRLWVNATCGARGAE